MERYVIKPQIKTVYGLKVDKDTNIDESTKFENEYVTQDIYQTVKDLVFTTHLTSKREVNGKKLEEDTKTVVELNEGTILVWTETEGYILAENMICTHDELIEEINIIMEAYKEEI